LAFEKNIFYQKGLSQSSQFEEAYIALRKKENRLYEDAIVKDLPQIPKMHPLRNEWLLRSTSLRKLVVHLRSRRSCKLVLEIGCGNGWLSHRLSEGLDVEVCAIDINQKELLQGARVFSGNERICFTYADVFSLPNDFVAFDTIVLASSIQYFPYLKKLIDRLLKLLSYHGEIHIIDSPLYPTAGVAKLARGRSEQYFKSIGFPAMTANYYHHTIDELSAYNHRVLFDPNLIMSRLAGKIFRKPRPVFPWIVVGR
jgi:ubiquinone/menaquinone biosynthesis C-methylase UbiE